LIALAVIAVAGAALLMVSHRLVPAVELAERPSARLHQTGSVAK